MATCAVMFIFVNEDGGATDFQEHCFDDSVDGLHPVIATEISNNEAGMSYSILVVKLFFCFLVFSYRISCPCFFYNLFTF